MQDIKTYIPSKTVRVLLYFFGGLVILFLLVETGVATSFHHPEFGYLRSAYRHFGIPHVLFLRGPGTVGTVASVSGSTFTVAMRDGSVRTVTVGASTFVHGHRIASSTELLPGETVVVFGRPRANGSIDARLIRILSIASSSRAGQMIIRN